MYVGQPENLAQPQSVLFDAPANERIVRAAITDDNLLAIVALADATQSDDFIFNRLLAIPLETGVPVTLDDGTVGEVGAIFSNGFESPEIVGDQVFYLKGFDDGQLGYYVVDLPDSSGVPGDFNGDGIVNGADFLHWQREDGTVAGLNAWQTNYDGPAPLAHVAVPEPASAALCLAAFSLAVSFGRNRRTN